MSDNEVGGVAGQNPAGNPSDAALGALSAEIVRLSGIIHKANTERDEAKARAAQSERDEQEWRGIVETYGRVQHWRLESTNEERMVFTVDRLVLRAAGEHNAPMVFFDGLKKVLRGRFAKYRAAGNSGEVSGQQRPHGLATLPSNSED